MKALTAGLPGRSRNTVFLGDWVLGHFLGQRGRGQQRPPLLARWVYINIWWVALIFQVLSKGLDRRLGGAHSCHEETLLWRLVVLQQLPLP